MVHASASRLIIMQLRTIEALRVRVQLSMRQTQKQEVQGQSLLLHTDCKAKWMKAHTIAMAENELTHCPWRHSTS